MIATDNQKHIINKRLVTLSTYSRYTNNCIYLSVYLPIFPTVKWPLVFLVYINDLVELLASFNIKVKLFAGDVRLYVNC